MMTYNLRFFDRNIQIWLAYKFTNVSLAQIGRQYGISSTTVVQIAAKLDRRVHGFLYRTIEVGEEIPEEAMINGSILYGIRIVYEPDEEYPKPHLYLEDPEKISALPRPEKRPPKQRSNWRYTRPISHIVELEQPPCK
jgi:hypothetical protein